MWAEWGTGALLLRSTQVVDSRLSRKAKCLALPCTLQACKRWPQTAARATRAGDAVLVCGCRLSRGGTYSTKSLNESVSELTVT